MTNKTKGKIKSAVAAIVALVLAGGVATSLYMGVKNNGWFEKTDTEQTTPGDDTDDENTDSASDDGGAVLSENVSNGMKLTTTKIERSAFSASAVSETADSAFYLSAYLTPETVSNGEVDWSIDFVNPSSSWAYGKKVTDYVTLTPVSDSNTLQMTVTCLQAFGEQIKITATSCDNSSISASATVDYVKRIQSLSPTFSGTTGSATCSGTTYSATSSTIACPSDVTDAEIINSISFNPTFGTGTIEEKYSFTITLSTSCSELEDSVDTSNTTYSYSGVSLSSTYT